MTTRTKRSAYVLAFVLGFAFGIALLQLSVGLAQYTGGHVALPRFWLFWLLGANPVVFVACEVMQRRDLCVGLGFDSGPLEWSEHVWLFLAQGVPFGLLALLGRKLASKSFKPDSPS